MVTELSVERFSNTVVIKETPFGEYRYNITKFNTQPNLTRVSHYVDRETIPFNWIVI